MITKKFGITDEKIEELVDFTKDKRNCSASGSNSKAYIKDDFIVLTTTNIPLGDYFNPNNKIPYDEVILLGQKLKSEGVNLVPIIGYSFDESKLDKNEHELYGKGYIFQPRAKGIEMWDRSKMPNPYKLESASEGKLYIINRIKVLANAPQKHYDKFVSDYKKITDSMLAVDPKTTNFFYDEKVGFSFIDLNFKANKKLYERPDLYGNKNHRWFISQNLSSCLKRLDMESIYTEEERDFILKSNIEIFKKSVKALNKIGVNKKDIQEAFKSQETEMSILGGISFYGINNDNLDSILKTCLLEDVKEDRSR